MLKHHRMRSAARKRSLFIATTMVAAIGVLGAASPALAKPTGPYAVFEQCPTTVPGVVLCQYAQTTGGEFVVGTTKLKVPINKTITLQGGGIANPAEHNSFFLYPASNGESLSKTELNVPGGLLDLINCEEITGNGFFEWAAREACKAVFENKTTGVTATTELVATETNPAILQLAKLIVGEGTALTLPVRVHLKNPFLGNSCYIGSAASPIQLHLTTGTTSPPEPNKPISGNVGFFEEEENVTVISDNSLVDNAFSAPTTEGCGEFLGITGFLDSLVNKKIGLPSTAGHNTAILNGTLRTATAKSVKNSE
jgi:hypothetical protein